MNPPIAISAEQLAEWNAAIAEAVEDGTRLLGAWISRFEIAEDGQMEIELLLMLSDGRVLRPHGKISITTGAERFLSSSIH